MESPETLHECDFFLLSSHTPYHADTSLPKFACQGKHNPDGWEIGFYKNGKATVKRCG